MCGNLPEEMSDISMVKKMQYILKGDSFHLRNVKQDKTLMLSLWLLFLLYTTTSEFGLGVLIYDLAEMETDVFRRSNYILISWV